MWLSFIALLFIMGLRINLFDLRLDQVQLNQTKITSLLSLA